MASQITPWEFIGFLTAIAATPIALVTIAEFANSILKTMGAGAMKQTNYNAIIDRMTEDYTREVANDPMKEDSGDDWDLYVFRRLKRECSLSVEKANQVLDDFVPVDHVEQDIERAWQNILDRHDTAYPSEVVLLTCDVCGEKHDKDYRHYYCDVCGLCYDEEDPCLYH